MHDLIIFSGCPCSGKSTVSELLRGELGCPLFDFASFRDVHLDKDWSNASAEEENMAFENLVFILKNYIKHGYKNVVVDDLEEDRVQALTDIFKDLSFASITLTVDSDNTLRERMANREGEYKDIERTLEWNRMVKERPPLPHEIRLDNSGISPEETVAKIMSHLSA
ncbi:MAG: AAA family ATPase [bacterium]